MLRVNESNYLQVIQNTMSALGAVSAHLAKDKVRNRAQITGLNNAMKILQDIMRAERRKSVLTRNNNYYQQRIAEEYERRHTIREQAREAYVHRMEQRG